MADDKLRIVATVEDQFTGPLSKLQKSLKGVGDETAKQGAVWKKDWEGARTEVAKFQGVLGGFAPILSAVGVGSFGAALSITGITSALKAFTGNTQGLSIMARETGVTIDKLRAFGELGERFGVSADAMKSSVGSFATTMYDLRRRWGEAYTGLQAMNLGKLAEDLVNAPNMEAALKRAMDGLQAIPEPEVRRRVSRMLFGTEDVGRVAASIGGDIGATLDEIARKMGRTTQGQVEAAQRFERSMSDLRANMEGLKTGALTPLIDEFNRLVTYLNRPESVSFFKGELDRVGQGLKDTATEAQQLMQLWERFKGVFSDDTHAPPAFAKKPGASGSPAAPSEAEIRRGQLEGRQASVERQKQLLERNPDAVDYQRKHDRMVDELKRVGDELQRLREQGGGASVSPSSYGAGGAGSGSLIQKAAWGGFGGPLGTATGAGPLGSGSGSGAGGSPNAPVPHGQQIDRGMPDLGAGIRGRPFGSKGTLGGSQGPLGADAVVTDRGMLDLIARAEGTTKRGYNDSFAHQVPGELSGKTLGEIEQIQRRMRGSSAIGRYQFMRGTLFGSGRKGDQGLMGELGLSRDDKFTPELQDRLANALIERRYKEAKRAQARNGGDFMRHFRTALAREWASFPGDYGQRGRNGGMYPGQSASIGRDRLTEGAQRWLDEREGRLAKSPLSTTRRSEVLADPNDERRKADDDGIKQLKPWTKVPAIPSPVTRVDMENDGGMYGGTGALKGKDDEFEAWLKRMHEEEAKNPISPEQLEQQRRGYDRDAFVDAMKERAGRGTKFGSAENEAVNDPDRTTADGLKRSLAYYGSKMRGWTGEVEEDDALRRSRLQGRSSDPAYRPDKDLSLDEVRKFRGPDRKVGDALMDRFYGKGATGGGPAMQMPGGSGAGGKGKLDIHLHGFPAGAQARTSMDDLFKETSVSKGRPQMDMGRA
jgi:muramidase (phage lysozyme)